MSTRATLGRERDTVGTALCGERTAGLRVAGARVTVDVRVGVRVTVRARVEPGPVTTWRLGAREADVVRTVVGRRGTPR